MHDAIRTQKAESPRGAITVMAALVMILLMALLALAIDVGCLAYTKTQLQSAADAAALGACLELPTGLGRTPLLSASSTAENARSAALNVASKHSAGPSSSVSFDPRQRVILGNGRMASGNWTEVWNHEPYNVVQVTAAFDGKGMPALPLFFAPLSAAEPTQLKPQPRPR